MKSFAVTLLIWAALFAIVWAALHEFFFQPGDWIGALVVSFFSALGIGALRRARIDRRDGALVARATDAPRDGQRIAIAGTLEAAGEPLHAPFSGAECLVYDYSVEHLSRPKISDKPTVVVDRGGLALAPSVIRAGVRSIRLLAFPGLERFTEHRTSELSETGQQYLANTPFEETNSLFAMPQIAQLVKDNSGAIRKDWKLTSHDTLAGSTFLERFVPTNERVCVIGRYSAKDNAIVPEANKGGVRVIRGGQSDVLEFLHDSRLGSLIGATLLILLPAIATVWLLVIRERYLERNGEPSLRSTRTEKFVTAATGGDVEALRSLLRHGVNINAPGPNGYPALANAHDAKTAEALIAAGADVNAPGYEGATPLMFAAGEGNAAVVRVLVRHGAALNTFNRMSGGTALSFAENAGHEDVAQILRAAGARREER